MSRADLRQRLRQLRAERLDAAEAGLTACPDYMADLEAEVAECLQELTLATVTEIALRRSELPGPLYG